MDWIEDASYVGPDRRKRPGSLRIMDRRRRHPNVTRPPHLPVALRRLRLQVFSVVGDAALRTFMTQVVGIANLARYMRRDDVADILTALVRDLTGAPAGDHRAKIEAALDASDLRLNENPYTFSWVQEAEQARPFGRR